MSAMGRPKKLTDNRAACTFYLDAKTRKAIDEYVYQKKQDNPDYSRSDFINEAAEHYLRTIRRNSK